MVLWAKDGPSFNSREGDEMSKKIATSIPIPPELRGGRKTNYGWNLMEREHSVSFESEEEFSKALRAAKAWGRRHEKEFDGMWYRGRYRIWRIK